MCKKCYCPPPLLLSVPLLWFWKQLTEKRTEQNIKHYWQGPSLNCFKDWSDQIFIFLSNLFVNANTFNNNLTNLLQNLTGSSASWARNSCIADIEIKAWSRSFVNLQINLIELQSFIYHQNKSVHIGYRDQATGITSIRHKSSQLRLYLKFRSHLNQVGTLETNGFPRKSVIRISTPPHLGQELLCG